MALEPRYCSDCGANVEEGDDHTPGCSLRPCCPQGEPGAGPCPECERDLRAESRGGSL